VAYIDDCLTILNMVRPSPKRTYDNSFREQKAEDTRDRILQALTDLLADPEIKLVDLSVGRIAEGAGVSEPTVYRHFPNREAMFEAFDGWYGDRMGKFEMPANLDELAALPTRLFVYYDEHADLIRASRTRNDVAQIGMKARRRRDKLVTDALAPVTSHLEPKQAQARAAVFRYLNSSQAWHTLTSELGVESKDGADAVTWALETLLAQLRRDGSRQAKPEKSRSKSSSSIRRTRRKEKP